MKEITIGHGEYPHIESGLKPYALLPYGVDGICAGDAVKVVDLSTGESCVKLVTCISGTQGVEAKTILGFASVKDMALNAVRRLAETEEKGVAGCTFGDSDYDSISVAYGYNYAMGLIRKALAKNGGV